MEKGESAMRDFDRAKVAEGEGTVLVEEPNSNKLE